MVTVPAEMPVTTPVALPTVAIAVLLLDQVPPPVESDRVVVFPTHTRGVPVIEETAYDANANSKLNRVRINVFFIKNRLCGLKNYLFIKS